MRRSYFRIGICGEGAELKGDLRWRIEREIGFPASAKNELRVNEGEQQEEKTEAGTSKGGHPELPSEPIDLTLGVSWMVEGLREFGAESFVTSVRLSWDEVLRNFPLEADEAKNRTALLRSFSNAMAARFRAAIQLQGYGRPLRLSGSIEAGTFDRILQTLGAAGYIEETERPQHLKQGRYWRLTNKQAHL
jgi:hypothetical protein